MVKMTRRLTVAILAAVLLAGSAAQAELLVYEQFDYGEANNIGGLDGGGGTVGFDGGWVMTGSGSGDNNFVQIQTPGLTAAALGVDAAGGKAVTPGDWDSDVYATRTLASGLGTNGTSLWIATLQSFENGSTNNTGGLVLTSAGTAVFIIGDPESTTAHNWGVGGGTIGFGANEGAGIFGVSDSDIDQDSDADLLVARINFAAGNETVDLWMNPNLTAGTPSDDDRAVAGLVLTDFTFDGLLLGTGSGDNYRLGVDEMRIADSFEDLTPIPEPATMTLLALGGLAAVRRRRR